MRRKGFGENRSLAAEQAPTRREAFRAENRGDPVGRRRRVTPPSTASFLTKYQFVSLARLWPIDCARFVANPVLQQGHAGVGKRPESLPDVLKAHSTRRVLRYFKSAECRRVVLRSGVARLGDCGRCRR